MSLKTALKLRTKTAALRGIEQTLAAVARWNQKRYFAAMDNTRLTREGRRARMVWASQQAREIEDLRMQTRQLVEAHRFDIIMYNEGMGDRAETEARAN